MPSIAPRAEAILILDSEGRRMVAKYSRSFLLAARAKQATFEATLFSKTKNVKMGSDSEVIMLENKIVVFKARADLVIYVVGSRDENELITEMVLDAVVGALSILLSGDFTSTFLLQHLDVALLTVDEVADDGIILETDPKSIVNRVLMRGIDGSQPMTDMSLAQAMEVAKEQLLKNVV